MGDVNSYRRASSAPAPAVEERTRRRATGSDLDRAGAPALSLLESLEIRRVSLFPRSRRVGWHAPRRRRVAGGDEQRFLPFFALYSPGWTSSRTRRALSDGCGAAVKKHRSSVRKQLVG